MSFLICGFAIQILDNVNDRVGLPKPRVPRAECIKYSVELVILRSHQVKAHRDLNYLKAYKDALIRKASPLDPRLNPILCKVDAEVARCEEALKFATQPMMSRIEYLSGLSDVAPPHDILCPDSDDSPPPDPQAIISWTEKEAEKICEIIDKLKAELLLQAPTPASPQGQGKNGDDLNLAKRKRLDDGSYAPSSSPAAVPDVQTQPLQLSELPKAIINLGLEADELDSRLDSIEKDTLAKISQRINSFRRSTIPGTPGDMQAPPLAERTKLELEQQNKEWSDAKNVDMESLDEIIKKKEKRNEKMKGMNVQLRAKVEKVQRETDLETSRNLLTALVPTVSPNPSSATLLQNPYFLQLTLPLRQELREAANNTLYTVLSSAWEDIERDTLVVSEGTSQQLWSALGENIKASERLLSAILGSV